MRPAALLWAGWLAACAGTAEPPPAPGPTLGPAPAPVERAPAPEAPKGPAAPNFLVIVADDLGTDKLAAYGEGRVVPSTPHLDKLAAESVLFRNAYVYPVCSATRAALLTGRYGRRTGMGGIIELGRSEYELPLAEVTLPEALDLGGRAKGLQWSAIAVGKWHLAGYQTPSAFRHPLLQGFDHYRGTFGNLVNTSRPYGQRGSYYQHERTVDGQQSWSTTYATTETADDAIAALGELEGPWLLWVAFHAAHSPFDPPPPALARAPATAADPEFRRQHAMVEALDTEIGRVLAALGPQREHTYIVFVGDNGTDKGAVLPPFEPSHAKASVYEGGTNVPLLIAGPRVGKGEAQALVHAVDLLPTLLDLAGVPPPDVVLDGVSFARVLSDPSHRGPRKTIFTERFSPVGPGPYDLDMVAIRDERYKLLRMRGKLTFHDLQGRHDDGPAIPIRDLGPGERQRYEALRNELERTLSEAKFAY
jgi:arylsulfatase A-like enzyme